MSEGWKPSKAPQESGAAAAPAPEPGVFPGAEMFRDEKGEPWARIKMADHFENLSIKSEAFKLLVTRRLRELTGEMPKTSVVKETLRELEGAAMFDGPVHPVSLRTAAHGNDIYIDLATPDWSAVHVNPDGWSVVTNPPVRFKRTSGTLALPIPAHDTQAPEERWLEAADATEAVTRLFDYVNLPDRASQVLTLAWLVSALHPSIPCPILVMNGEQGSAKTTTQTILRLLIDPSGIPLASTPRDERDLVITAKHHHLLAFDNLSNISDTFSDALCRMVTGSTFATRQLYTDNDLVTFSGRRPIMFNGIEHVATRSDLLDRIILLTLPTIKSRRSEQAVMQGFTKEAPAIFGALLTAMSYGIKFTSKLNFDEERVPRMADFFEYSTAALLALGVSTKELHDAYSENRTELKRVAIENSAAVDVIEWFNRRKPQQFFQQSGSGIHEHQGNQLVRWRGTYKELLKVSSDFDGRAAGFPKTPRALAAEMARSQPNLATAGLRLKHLPREAGTGRRLIEITRIGNFASGPKEQVTKQKGYNSSQSREQSSEGS